MVLLRNSSLIRGEDWNTPWELYLPHVRVRSKSLTMKKPRFPPFTMAFLFAAASLEVYTDAIGEIKKKMISDMKIVTLKI